MRAASANNEFGKVTNLSLYYKGKVANKEQWQAINDLARELRPDWNDPAYKSWRLREGEKQSALQDTQKAVLQERAEAHKAQAEAVQEPSPDEPESQEPMPTDAANAASLGALGEVAPDSEQLDATPTVTDDSTTQESRGSGCTVGQREGAVKPTETGCA